jgi:rhodanese-related sulfurtransferase
VAQKLIKQGYKNVHPLQGGYYIWRDAGYPVERKGLIKKGDSDG